MLKFDSARTQARRIVGDRMPGPENIGAVQAVTGDRVGGGEAPAGEDRLHDLEAMGDPVDAAEKRRVVHVGPRRGGEMKDDLGLDPRLGQAGEGEAPADRGMITHRAVEHEVPDRSVDAIDALDRRVGEADLAADRPLAPGSAQVADLCRDPIGFAEIEPRMSRRERLDLPPRAEQAQRLRGDRLDAPRLLLCIDAHDQGRPVCKVQEQG